MNPLTVNKFGRQCLTCGVFKEWTAYSLSSSKSEYSSHCKQCDSEKIKAYRDRTVQGVKTCKSCIRVLPKTFFLQPRDRYCPECQDAHLVVKTNLPQRVILPPPELVQVKEVDLIPGINIPGIAVIETKELTPEELNPEGTNPPPVVSTTAFGDISPPVEMIDFTKLTKEQFVKLVQAMQSFSVTSSNLEIAQQRPLASNCNLYI